MISLLSIIFKILFCLAVSCVFIFTVNKNETNISKNKRLLTFSLVSISLLSIIYNLSSSGNFIVYSASILSLFLITLIIVYINNNDIKSYLFINFLSIAISIGYFFISLFVFLLFVLIDRYYIYIEEYFYFESINSKKSELNE